MITTTPLYADGMFGIVLADEGEFWFLGTDGNGFEEVARIPNNRSLNALTATTTIGTVCYVDGSWQLVLNPLTDDQLRFINSALEEGHDVIERARQSEG